MIRTLQMYLGRELAKVTLLALASFTLVMTVFAIIEPLRKQGLAGEQVVSLVAFTLPVMLSFTLPIASLFAATIVYGRFAQDNELMACRASGIGTLSLLRPALVLGAIVTAVSLFLSNFVTPGMAQRGQRAIKADALKIVYQQISSQSSVKFDQRIIHADSAEIQEGMLRLKGVVFVEVTPAEAKPDPRQPGKVEIKPESLMFVTATGATVQFDSEVGEWYASVELENPVMTRTGDQSTGMEALQRPIESMPVPNAYKDKASFLDWYRLWEVIGQPAQHREIQKHLIGVVRSIRHDMFRNEVVDAIKAHGQYDLLKKRREDGVTVSYVIRAASASKATGFVATLAGGDVGGKHQSVEVVVLEDGKPVQTVSSELAVVAATWSTRAKESQASIEMRDKAGVLVRLPGEEAKQALRRTGWGVGQLPLPEKVAAAADKIQPNDVYTSPRESTSNPTILARLDNINTNILNKFKGDLVGELHGRVAYSVSCFLMVALGAALGLIYRGGQLVSAFALCAVPASIVIVMMIMGKQLVSNTQVQIKYGAYGMVPGLAAIWSGIVVLLVANAIIYARLSRK